MRQSTRIWTALIAAATFALAASAAAPASGAAEEFLLVGKLSAVEVSDDGDVKQVAIETAGEKFLLDPRGKGRQLLARVGQTVTITVAPKGKRDGMIFVRVKQFHEDGLKPEDEKIELPL